MGSVKTTLPAGPAGAGASPAAASAPPKLLRIQEAAAEVGLTARSVRYYEEVGLLLPAARSEGDYRLYDESDVERLRFIKGLRDDAGFSIAEIARLLEDQDARERDHAAYHATTDPVERRRLLLERVASFDRQIETLKHKIVRLEEMVAETEGRRARTQARVAELAAEPKPGADATAGAEPGKKPEALR
jgi:DNA-binding transcriptional MerR regulator